MQKLDRVKARRETARKNALSGERSIEKFRWWIIWDAAYWELVRKEIRGY